MNKKIISAVISACLHTKAESERLTRKEITDTAAAIRVALTSLYPITDREWEEVLREIANYADCLI